MGDESARLLPIWTGGERESLIFAPGRTGWARLASPLYHDRALVFLNFGRVSDTAPIVIRELRFETPQGMDPSLDTRLLRRFPLGRLVAAVNLHRNYGLVAERIEPSPWSAPTPPFPEVTIEEGVPPDQVGWAWFQYELDADRIRAPRLRMKIPEGQPKPDSFYEQVAERFAYLQITSPRPATDLAEANNVPVTTVHGWVKEARRRGLLLLPGERSKGTTP